MTYSSRCMLTPRRNIQTKTQKALDKTRTQLKVLVSVLFFIFGNQKRFSKWGHPAHKERPETWECEWRCDAGEVSSQPPTVLYVSARSVRGQWASALWSVRSFDQHSLLLERNTTPGKEDVQQGKPPEVYGKNRLSNLPFSWMERYVCPEQS